MSNNFAAQEVRKRIKQLNKLDLKGNTAFYRLVCVAFLFAFLAIQYELFAIRDTMARYRR